VTERRAPHEPRRVGIVCDYAEEGWPSMDLAAELIELALREHTGGRFVPVLLRPGLPRIARRLSSGGGARNADRYLGRYLAFPRWLAKYADDFHLFHVVDHSYAHLVHALPANRTVVTCHDLDAFRSLLHPAAEPRPFWFRATMKRVFSGMKKAARVTTDAEAVREQLVTGEGFAPRRVVTVPLPVHPDFSPRADRAADAEAEKLAGGASDAVELLHVGSTVLRKRIDLLLRVFAAVRARHPSARLVRVGGALTEEQRALAGELGVAGHLTEVPFVTRPVLAALYRRASAVLAPSEREGFGLPLVEAMACGTPVVASDLAVFREVGGEVVVYRALDDEEGWVEAVDTVLRDRRDPRERAGRRQAALERAAAFGIEAYAARLAEVYRGVPGGVGR
jgi:glycosyltransferase involved in cell wall biosynthesis